QPYTPSLHDALPISIIFVALMMRLSLNHIMSAVLAVGPLLAPGKAVAQESPYIVTYDHHMEEPHALEISLTPVVAAPKQGNHFADRKSTRLNSSHQI